LTLYFEPLAHLYRPPARTHRLPCGNVATLLAFAAFAARALGESGRASTGRRLTVSGAVPSYLRGDRTDPRGDFLGGPVNMPRRLSTPSFNVQARHKSIFRGIEQQRPGSAIVPTADRLSRSPPHGSPWAPVELEFS
jgi:hypothetical protein